MVQTKEELATLKERNIIKYIIKKIVKN